MIIADVVCPLCKRIIGGCDGVPSVTVRFFCQHCHREVTIAERPTKYCAIDKTQVAVL